MARLSPAQRNKLEYLRIAGFVDVADINGVEKMTFEALRKKGLAVLQNTHELKGGFYAHREIYDKFVEDSS